MRKGITAPAIAICLIACGMCFNACEAKKQDSGAYDKAMAALYSGDHELAFNEFKKAADNDGREAEGYRGEGLVYYEEGDYEHAIMMFDLSLDKMKYENKEFEEDVKLYKADAYTKNGDADSAAVIYAELEESDSAYIAYARQGEIFLKQNDREKAAEYFEKSLTAKQDIETCLYIYESYKSVNLEGDGSKYLEKAVTMTPSDKEDYVNIGLVYEYLEDFDNAVSSFNTAIDHGCDGAVDELGRLYLDKGDVPAAKSLYTNNLKQGKNIAAAYNGLAMCAIKETNYDSALTYVEQGLSCGDQNENKALLFNEIIAYEYKLDFDTAKQKMEVYLGIYPDDEKAINEYKFLSHGTIS